MPVIPTYQRHITIPGGGANVFGDIESAGVVGKAISNFGNTVTDSKNMFGKIASYVDGQSSGGSAKTGEKNNTGGAVENYSAVVDTSAQSSTGGTINSNSQDMIIQTKVDQEFEKDKYVAVNFGNTYRDQTNNYIEQMMPQFQGLSAFGMTDSIKAWMEENTNKSLSIVPEYMREQMAAIYNEVNNKALDDITLKELELREQYKFGIIQNTTDLAQKQILENYNSCYDVNNNIYDYTRKLISLGVPQFTIMRNSASMISSAVQKAMDNDDVGSARDLMNENKSLIQAYGDYGKMEKQLQNVEKSVAVEKRYDEIYTNANGDFKAMQEFIHNPENQNSLGFDDDQKYYLVKKINDARIAHEKEIAAVQDKTATDVFTRIGSINPYQIDTLVDRGSLSYKQGEIFKQQIINGQPEVTNAHAFYGAYSKMLLAAGDSEAMMKVKGEIMFSPAISGSDKKKLIDVTGNTQSRSEALAIAKGMNYISSMLMPLNSSLGLPHSQADNDFVEAGKILIDEIAAAKQRGEPINSETIGKMSREVAGHFRISVGDYLVQNAVTNYSKQENNGNHLGINFTSAENNGTNTDKYDNIDDKYISKLNELIESSDTVKEIKDNYKKLREINEQLGKVRKERVDLETKLLKQGEWSEYETKRYNEQTSEEIKKLEAQQRELGANLAKIAGNVIYKKIWEMIVKP